MPIESWEQMDPDEKLNWLRVRILSLTDFINNVALTQLEAKIGQLATRVTALENRQADSEEAEPK
jgi:hypothetical protein